jgi:hypothetical protein
MPGEIPVKIHGHCQPLQTLKPALLVLTPVPHWPEPSFKSFYSDFTF